MSNQHPMNSVSSDDSDAPDEMDPELLVALNDYLNVIAANSPEQLRNLLHLVVSGFAVQVPELRLRHLPQHALLLLRRQL